VRPALPSSNRQSLSDTRAAAMKRARTALACACGREANGGPVGGGVLEGCSALPVGPWAILPLGPSAKHCRGMRPRDTMAAIQESGGGSDGLVRSGLPCGRGFFKPPAEPLYNPARGNNRALWFHRHRRGVILSGGATPPSCGVCKRASRTRETTGKMPPGLIQGRMFVAAVTFHFAPNKF
jgi:hypothetical protein